MNVFQQILQTGEQVAWEEVPVKVAFIVRKGGRVVQQIRQVLSKFPKEDGRDKIQVYWCPDKESIAISFPDGTDEPTKNRWQNRLRTIQGVSGVEMDCEWVPKDAVRIKSAAVSDALTGVWQGANRAIGGPNPLTNTIAGGLLAGGAGYAAGTIAEQVLPEEYFERGKLRRMMAAIAATPAVAGGLWSGSINSRVDGTGFLEGMTTSDNAPLKAASLLLADVEIDPRRIKAAYAFTQGGTAVQSIPVDAFNQAVWQDVRSGQNQYGTRSPWGNNEQVMHTPPAVGAAVTGIMSGIDAQQGGRGWVSPGDIVRGLAGAGVGLVTANVAGKALGALAGLRPDTQKRLQDAGAFGGFLMAVVPPLFGR